MVSVAGHDRIIVSDEYIVNYNIQYGLNGGQLQYVINNDTGNPKVYREDALSQLMASKETVKDKKS